MGETGGYDWRPDYKMKILNLNSVNYLKSKFRIPGILLIIISLFNACIPNKSYQTPGVESLQGIWVEKLGSEKSGPDNDYFSEFQFRFSCDSVYITTKVHSKYNYEDSHCFNNGQWTEYQKGGYTLSHDSLIVEGVFTKPNFRMKISGCHHSGNFHEVYKIRSLNIENDNLNRRDSLLIYPPHEEGTIHLYRTQKWICKPHKLE
jgi:hypothetical protein